MSDNQQESVLLCTECQVGKMVQRKVTNMIWTADDLVLVPDFPAWVCDFCGRCVYDPQAMNRLRMALNYGRAESKKKNFRLPKNPAA